MHMLCACMRAFVWGAALLSSMAAALAASVSRIAAAGHASRPLLKVHGRQQ